jgi:nitrite reductase (NADH) large subunit
MAKQRVVVVGNGMVGHRFIEYLLESPSKEQFEIVTFSEESRLAYDRVHLSAFFTGSTAADLALTTREYYRDNGVNFVLNDKVVSVDADAKVVVTASGRKEPYDKLVLATGLCRQSQVAIKNIAWFTAPLMTWVVSKYRVVKARSAW